MTENQLRSEIVNQAKSWLGRKEADGTHRVIIDVYNSIYPLPRGYRMSYTDPWCAAFVSACAQVWGLTKIIFPECGCGPMIELYKKAGRWVEDDGYLPQPADVIFYDWQDSGQGDNRGTPDHVGLVVDVQGDLITVCEGNMSDAVGTRTLFRDNRYIRGYGLPDYAAAAIVLSADEDPVGDEAPGAEAPVSIAGTITLPALRPGWCYVPLPVLQIGDESEAVRAAQLLLRGRGFPVGWMGADGDFGTKTESAVGKYQLDRQLERDGIIGPETWGKLITEGR